MLQIAGIIGLLALGATVLLIRGIGRKAVSRSGAVVAMAAVFAIASAVSVIILFGVQILHELTTGWTVAVVGIVVVLLGLSIAIARAVRWKPLPVLALLGVWVCAFVAVAVFAMTGISESLMVPVFETTIQQMADEFKEEIAQLRIIARDAAITAELWLRSKHGTWRFFLVTPDSLVEIDRDVVPQLQLQCRGRGELNVHLADALEFDFRALRGDGPRLRLVGNLPYNVSTPLLFHFLGQLDAVADMHFMLQKEVVTRMAARPGGKEYGRLTVMLAPWVRVEPLFDIGTGAFSPPPKVVSTFFVLRAHEQPPFDYGDRSAFARVVAAAFSQRRKTLRNSLGGLLTQAQITAAGVDPSLRPETLAPAQFAALARELVASGARDWSEEGRDL